MLEIIENIANWKNANRSNWKDQNKNTANKNRAWRAK